MIYKYYREPKKKVSVKMRLKEMPLYRFFFNRQDRGILKLNKKNK